MPQLHRNVFKANSRYGRKEKYYSTKIKTKISDFVIVTMQSILIVAGNEIGSQIEYATIVIVSTVKRVDVLRIPTVKIAGVLHTPIVKHVSRYGNRTVVGDKTNV